MTQREMLSDRAAHGEGHDVRGRHVENVEQRSGVVGEHLVVIAYAQGSMVLIGFLLLSDLGLA
jgi:hypothetical protein